MKTIQVKSCVSTGLDPALPLAKTIEIADSPLGQGGFGIAYRAGRFDGRQVAPQVVKLLTNPDAAAQGFSTVRELQKRLRAENTATSGKLLQTFPALQGVPQLSFEGELDGRDVVGYTAADLTVAGFDEFGGVLDDAVKYRTFQSLPISAKMRIASELVSAFGFLSTHIQFIHADIKAEALFLDLRGAHCAIIDFDSGALARDPSDRPTTFGTKQDWLAPEIIRQLDAPGNGTRRVKVDLLSDVWAVNVAVHYLLFGVHPLFFLTEISDRSIDAYFKQFKWPAVDPSFTFFRRTLEKTYKRYLAFAHGSVPAEVMRQLAFTVNSGFRQPAQRTSYGQWKVVLGASSQPRIRSFTADRLVVDNGAPVHLTWDVTGAAKLELSGVGDVTRKTSADVVVTRDTMFKLLLTDATGGKLVQRLAVKVDTRPPVITSFTTNQPLLRTASPARLSWQVTGAARLQIDNGVGDVSLSTHVDVLPQTNTRYTLTATSFFGAVATASVEVRVSDVAPAISFFRSDKSRLAGGEPVTLEWRVSSDAHAVSIAPLGKVDPSGSRTVQQRQTTVYVLTAASYFGPRSEARVQVDVVDAVPVIRAFKAVPPLVRHGDDAVLSWNVAGAERVWLEPAGIELPLSGTQALRPDRSTRFVLKARSWYGATAERQANVTVIRKTTRDDLEAATRERKRRLFGAADTPRHRR